MILCFRSCPHCQGIYRVTFSPNPVTVGQGVRLCSACKKSFNDGSKEWAEMNLLQRFHAYIPLLAKLWFGMGAAVIIYGATQGISGDFFGTAGSILIFFVLPWAPFWIYRTWTVKKSLRRKPLVKPA